MLIDVYRTENKIIVEPNQSFSMFGNNHQLTDASVICNTIEEAAEAVKAVVLNMKKYEEEDAADADDGRVILTFNHIPFTMRSKVREIASYYGLFKKDYDSHYDMLYDLAEKELTAGEYGACSTVLEKLKLKIKTEEGKANGNEN